VWVVLSDDISGYEPKKWAGDLRTEVVIEGDTPEQVAEATWFVGNRMGPDANGREWPSDVRSMCVGDVVFMVPETGSVRRLQVRGAGWGDPPAEFCATWGAGALREIGAAR
jgi:hypothetical protein